MQARFFAGALGTTYVGLGHVNEMFAAKSFYGHAPVEAQKAFFHSRLQHQVWITVGQQDFWHRAAAAIIGAPRFRAWIAQNEPAFLV